MGSWLSYLRVFDRTFARRTRILHMRSVPRLGHSGSYALVAAEHYRSAFRFSGWYGSGA
jgi:hypothetical protein